MGVAEAQLLHKAVLATCDLNDGIKDGLIGDPRQCRFDPATVACGGRRGTRHLPYRRAGDRRAQILLRPRRQQGQEDRLSGRVMPGSELFWIGDYIDGPGRPAQYRRFIADVFRYMGFNPGAGPNWTLADLDFDRDPARLAINETLYRADNPDLRQFKAAGGKFVGFQGWADTSVVPSGTVDFYQTVTRTMGGPGATTDFFRFYTVPGMRHCSADGDGGDTIDFLTALENWVERGQAPDMLVGYNFDWGGPANASPVWPLTPSQVRFARPHFPYPADARYSGTGDPADPKSWHRVVPKRSPDNG